MRDIAGFDNSRTNAFSLKESLLKTEVRTDPQSCEWEDLVVSDHKGRDVTLRMPRSRVSFCWGHVSGVLNRDSVGH